MAQVEAETLSAAEGGLPPLALLIAAPRGFCAGVDRAIRIVELAIEKFGAGAGARNPFQSTLENYHQPVNASANF